MIACAMSDERHEPADPRAREALILQHLGFARALARRYAGRGEPLDDLEQVATLGLIGAADRYRPDRGPFRAFAAPTILGELRRHFRDRAWAVRVPRGLKEDHATISRAVDRLSARGRTPTTAQVAEETGLDPERVLDAMAAQAAYRPDSLSSTPWGDEDDGALDVAREDAGFARVEDREALEAGVRDLPEREREILRLRFEEGLIQTEIAARLGISQMHVSRLLARSLESLRAGLDPGGAM
jgi:RNA polymerase sigma-B factor